MKLSAIHATNFRSYRAAMELGAIGPVAVLAGPNNSGKSNVIELLTWYRSMMLGQGVRDPSAMKHTGNKSGRLSVELEFELSPDEKVSLLQGMAYSDGKSRDLLHEGQFLTGIRHTFAFGESLEREAVEVRNLDGTWLPVFGWEPQETNVMAFWRLDLVTTVQRFAGAAAVAPGQKIQVQRVGGKRQQCGGWVLQGTREQDVANLISGFVQRWQEIPPVRQIQPRLDPAEEFVVQTGGVNLVRVLNTIQGDEATRFGEMMNDIYAIVPGLTRITAPMRGNEATAVVQEPGGVRVEAQDLSTGLKQTLILVISLLTYGRNSLILLEEPEIHLHAGSQRALLQFIKRMTKDRLHEFVITTHSTIFAEVSDEVSTFLVEKREGSSTIRQLTEGSELKQLKVVLGHENTDLFGYNAVLVVEGATEENAIPILARAAGFDLGRRGVRILNIRGKGNTTRLEQLLQFLKGSDTVPYLMLDGSDDVRAQVNDWVKEGLVKPENAFIWDRNFEDCFDDETLIRAVRDVTADAGAQVNVEPRALSEARNAGKSVVPVIEKAAYEQSGRSISKPALGEKLAELLGAVDRAAAQTPPQKGSRRDDGGHRPLVFPLRSSLVTQLRRTRTGSGSDPDRPTLLSG